MTTKEERERRRAERLEAEKREAASERRRLLLGYVTAGALSLAVIVGIFLVISGGDSESETPEASDFPAAAHIEPDFGVPDAEPDGREGTPPGPVEQGDLEVAAEEAGCDLQLDLEEEGSNHFTDVNKDQKYDTNPPTSGDHYGNNTEVAAGALADGAYSDMPPITRAVHSLEHGRIEIQYSPDLSEQDQLALKGVFDEAPGGMIMFPNSEMPYEVAVTAWTQLMGCDTYEGAATLDAIRDFRATYLGRGPENFPTQPLG